jgi:hypothetical protein
MRKKHLVIIAALIVVSAVSLTSCGRHRMGHGKDPEVLLRRVDARVRNLRLNETQQAQYEDLRARVKTDMEQDIARMAPLSSMVKDELNRENPDLEALAANLKSGAADMPVLRDRYIDYFVEFYNILDEAQQERVVKHLRRRVNRRHG